MYGEEVRRCGVVQVVRDGDRQLLWERIPRRVCDNARHSTVQSEKNLSQREK